MMDKRGQLGWIEMKFFFAGLFIGLIGGWVLIYLGVKKVIPFQIPVVCGPVLFGPAMFNKKGQLGVLEAKYFFIGLVIGLILSLVLVALGTTGTLPFRIPVCGGK